MLRFEDHFWGTGPDPTLGVRTLHTLFQQHLNEAEDLLKLVKARAAAEESLATALGDLGRHSPNNTTHGHVRRRSVMAAAGHMVGNGSSSPTSEKGRIVLGQIKEGWNQATAIISSAAGSVTASSKSGGGETAYPVTPVDTAAMAADEKKSVLNDPSSIQPIVRTLREHMVATAAAHRRHADTLTLSVLTPLQAFITQHRRAMTKKKTDVDQNWQRLGQLEKEIAAARSIYLARYQIAQEEDKKFKEESERGNEYRSTAPPPTHLMVGSRSLSGNEFHALMESLRKGTASKAVMTPVGLFESCYLGTDLVEALRKRYPGVPRGDLRAILLEMVRRGILTVVVGNTPAGDDAEETFDASVPYQFGRAMLSTGEPPHLCARAAADKARRQYEDGIKEGEHARAALEFCITDYLIAAQEGEEWRLKVVGEVVGALEAAQTFAGGEVGRIWTPSISEDKLTTECPDTVLDIPSPTESVQALARLHRTGHTHTPPFVFLPPPSSTAPRPHQCFGISLTDLAATTQSPIPPLLTACIRSLTTSFTAGRSSIDTWVKPNRDLTAVQILRVELNTRPDLVRALDKTLERYSAQVVAGVVKLFLAEMPEGVCRADMYDPLRDIYVDDFEHTHDNGERIRTIRTALSALPEPHRETFKLLTCYYHLLLKDIPDDDTRILQLACSMAPCILRPAQETNETLGHMHPWKFLLEVVLRWPEVFDGDRVETVLGVGVEGGELTVDVDGAARVGKVVRGGAAEGLLTPPVSGPSSPDRDRDEVTTGNRSSSSWFSWSRATTPPTEADDNNDADAATGKKYAAVTGGEHVGDEDPRDSRARNLDLRLKDVLRHVKSRKTEERKTLMSGEPEQGGEEESALKKRGSNSSIATVQSLRGGLVKGALPSVFDKVVGSRSPTPTASSPEPLLVQVAASPSPSPPSPEPVVETPTPTLAMTNPYEDILYETTDAPVAPDAPQPDSNSHVDSESDDDEDETATQFTDCDSESVRTGVTPHSEYASSASDSDSESEEDSEVSDSESVRDEYEDQVMVGHDGPDVNEYLAFGKE
ncbi:hypothetical protein DFS34DRAFT_425878 [Phlyctochytrium arcticum]|nr:hypothetical protein DFS34DRAFT_425878 [Phlyctochytrium arcticum]